MSSPTDRGRRLLPLLPTNHPLGRQAVTCQYRCGNACSHEATRPRAPATPPHGSRRPRPAASPTRLAA
ncbi:hypothetical protein FXN61_44695, partial [Lentzea sp. PSKA42]|nr:hypothetical protein [Lentzea indica]